MGLLMPTLARVREKSKITKAKADIKRLMLAIKPYENEYGYLSYAYNSSDLIQGKTVNSVFVWNDSDFYDILIPGLRNENPRGILMLSTESDGSFKDPWGHNYRVVMDLNYNGNIDDSLMFGNKTSGDYNGMILI